MSSEFHYDVFLSYSSKDRKTVHALAERLKQNGLRVWLDAWAIQPGDLIPLKIQQGLEQSRTLLMCMSPAYFASDWGKLEHQTLLFRDPTNARRRFIPLLIQDCSPPDIIAQFARIDYRMPSEEAHAKILVTCRGKGPEEPRPPERSKQADWICLVLKGHSGKIWSVAVTPDGKTIVSASGDKTLKVWDLVTGKCRATFKGLIGTVNAVAIAPDGKTAVSGSNEMLKVWGLANGECRATLEGHTSVVYGVAVTPDGKKVVSASQDKTLKVWDLETGQCCTTFKGHTGFVYSVTVTPDGKTIVSASQDKTLKLWDLKTGQCRATFKGHTGSLGCVRVTGDGRTIVSGSEDKTLKVWDIETGQCRATFKGHTGWIWCVAITPDCKKVVSGAFDNSLRVWDLPQPGEIVDAA